MKKEKEKIKSFGELVLQELTQESTDESTDESIIALYLDESLSEEDLIKEFGKNPLVYALISLNRHIADNVLYELSYPVLIHKKPKTQTQIDNIFCKLYKS